MFHIDPTPDPTPYGHLGFCDRWILGKKQTLPKEKNDVHHNDGGFRGEKSHGRIGGFLKN